MDVSFNVTEVFSVDFTHGVHSKRYHYLLHMIQRSFILLVELVSKCKAISGKEMSARKDENVETRED